MKLTRILAGGLLAAVAMGAHAVAPYHEYSKHVEGAQTLTALNDELMGDSISLYNGATEFSVTDIDLPGNNALPVRLSRRLPVILNSISVGAGSDGVSDAPLGGAGNWDVDVPYISGTYLSAAGWDANRCTYTSIPDAAGFAATDFWHGNTVHVPGGSDRLMLTLESATPRPSGGAPSIWITRERDMFTCIPMLSGLAGQGFQMQTTSGLRYDFNIAVSRYLGYMTRSVSNGDAAFSYTTSRLKWFLLASKITDRFGNTVSFSYNAEGYPTQIVSSDDGGTQRKITLAYSNGRLLSATANGRTWQYQYGSDGMLSAVVRPDASRWQYAYAGALNPVAENWDGFVGTNCLARPPPTPAAYTLAITHPGGAVGTFLFASKRHYRSGVHQGACVQELVQSNGTWVTLGHLYTPNYFDVMSLTSKTLSGPGLAQPMVWTYDYGINIQQLWGSGGAAVYPCTTCATEKTVTVVRPDGATQSDRYGFLYAVNEGRLLGSRIVAADGTVHRTESTTYMSEAEAASQSAFHVRYGIIIGSDGPSTATVRPVVRQSIEQDGAIFMTQVDTGCSGSGVYCFDKYGNPTQVTKSSSGSAAYTRTERTAYFHQEAAWLLGQMQSVTCTAPSGCAGLVMSHTAYDANTALPLQSYAFGKLKQTLSYNANGTVATVADGGGHLTTLSSWKRGIPQTVTYPATTDQPTAVRQSAAVDDNGWITAISDENGFATGYAYDAMGRVAKITYPTGDSSSWSETTLSYQQIAGAEYGIPANHWKQTVSTGNGRKVVYFDAFWRPLVEEAYDSADPANTRSITVKRYDIRGRPAFQSYPLGSLTNYADTALTGTDTRYDALDRVIQIDQDSELGALTTATTYLSGFRRQTRNPRGQVTTESFQAWDAPTYDTPVRIEAPLGVVTAIARDAFGKPLEMTRSGPDG